MTLATETLTEAASGTGEGSHLLITIEGVGVLSWFLESKLMIAIKTMLLAVKSPSLVLFVYEPGLSGKGAKYTRSIDLCVKHSVFSLQHKHI